MAQSSERQQGDKGIKADASYDISSRKKFEFFAGKGADANRENKPDQGEGDAEAQQLFALQIKLGGRFADARLAFSNPRDAGSHAHSNIFGGATIDIGRFGKTSERLERCSPGIVDVAVVGINLGGLLVFFQGQLLQTKERESLAPVKE